MFLLTGITGNVGGSAARHLLAQGKQLRALVRDPAKPAPWAAQGVELLPGDWNDPASLTAALHDVEGAYLMMPPSQTPSRDFREAKAVAANYREALLAAPPPRVVALSSIGSEQPERLGLITSTHILEQTLAGLPIPIAFIRAGSFLENYRFGLGTGAQSGTLPTFYAPADRKIPMIATEDIGAQVAHLLAGPAWTGTRHIELGSPVSPDDLAQALTRVLGRDVTAQPIPREAWSAALQGMGTPADSTWAFEEMTESVNNNWIHFGVPGTEPVSGTTSADDVFAAAAKP